MYEEKDYCCPKCGTHSSECKCVDYGYDCPKCRTHFETPDS